MNHIYLPPFSIPLFSPSPEFLSLAMSRPSPPFPTLWYDPEWKKERQKERKRNVRYLRGQTSTEWGFGLVCGLLACCRLKQWPRGCAVLPSSAWISSPSTHLHTPLLLLICPLSVSSIVCTCVCDCVCVFLWTTLFCLPFSHPFLKPPAQRIVTVVIVTKGHSQSVRLVGTVRRTVACKL